MEIRPVESAANLDEVRRLFEEYWAAFGFTPYFQNFDQELAGLPGAYAPPGGRLGLAWVDDAVAGCVALRRVDAERGEMKRLFVRPAFRGRRLGRALLDWLIADARRAGYRELVCDTLPVMADALAMYQRAGFERTGPYAGVSTPDTIYLRLLL